nr:hypothetical protein [Paraburkholderia lycopersici]
MKSTSGKSLRWQVEKWLAPASALPVHVIEFSRTRRGGSRYVYVATADGSRALFFFRHDDGAWSVCPPALDGRGPLVRPRSP